MKKRNPWEPKPLLDDHPWSLFPNIDLPRFVEFMAVAIWIGLVGVIAVLKAHSWLRVLPTAVLGAWALHYICARLGGRAAHVGGAAPPIRPDSPFQARLAFDFMSIVVLATTVYSLVSS
jgi:hypothetical protein